MLSVIIPTYNRRPTIERALMSVMSQKCSVEIECIVVDDGSSDGSFELIAQRFPSVRLIQQQNQGVSSARNLGLSVARGKWLAFLDSDDEWLPHKLTRQMELLESTGLKVCHTEEIWIRNGVRVNQMNKHQKRGGRIFLDCLPLCAMSPSSIMIHESIFDRIGNFDTQLPACEDYDLWLRICSEYEVAFVSEPCVNKYGGHSDQLSRQYWGMDRFRVLALQKVLEKHGQFLDKFEYESAVEILMTKLQILSKGAAKHENEELRQKCEQSLTKWKMHSRSDPDNSVCVPDS